MKAPIAAARGLLARLPEETLRYLIAGVLTTLTDFLLFTLLVALGVPDMTANGVSISAAVIFAYVINKLYVFRRRSAGVPALAAEFLKFIAGRAVTILLELFGYAPLLRILGGREFIAKAVTIAVVFVLNYIISKLFVFRDKKR